MGDSSPKPPVPEPFVFPRWTNRLREASVVLGAGGLLYAVVLLVLLLSPRSTAVGYAPEQPVPYSHALHAGELGIDCRYCHGSVERGARASVPPAATCMNCHRSVRTQSEKLAPVRASSEGGPPVRWVRIHDLPDFVYFDHSAHLNAGLGCVTCHGRVDRMEIVRQEKPLTMGWCLDCHRTPRPHLRPRSRITDMQWQPEGDARALGERLFREHELTPSTDCSVCHR